MDNEKNWLSCKEAAKLLNMSQRNIGNLIKQGKFRAEKNDDGRYIIMKSEFFTAYPFLMNIEKPGNGEKYMEEQAKKMLEEKVRHLQEMVDEKRKQNDFLIEQLSNFTQEKSKMLDAINSHTRLLEFKETTIRPNTTTIEGRADKESNWKWPFKKR